VAKLKGFSLRITILALLGWLAIGIGIFFALWVSFLISTSFAGCGIIFCHWTGEMLLRILIITALPMALGFLILQHDEKRHARTRKKAS
jgi:hypothetical protein